MAEPSFKILAEGEERTASMIDEPAGLGRVFGVGVPSDDI